MEIKILNNFFHKHGKYALFIMSIKTVCFGGFISSFTEAVAEQNVPRTIPRNMVNV